MVETTDANFQTDVLDAHLPVLVDFFAPWCGPCRVLAPVIEEIAEETEGLLTVAKINIDENPLFPAKYGIRSIPSLLLFNKGQVVGTQIGLQNKGYLMDWVQGFLKKKA